MPERASLAMKTCKRCTFRSLVYYMLPKDNLCKNIYYLSFVFMHAYCNCHAD